MGVPRNAVINCSISVPDSSQNFGNQGAKMLGYYAWDYNGFKGPLNFLNSLNTWAVPELPNPTGLYLILKSGVQGTVTMGVNEFQQTAMLSTLGTINMMANQLTGLVPAANL
jgi:hypothetical protein